MLNSALLSASAYGHIEIVDRLLAAGATCNDFQPLLASFSTSAPVEGHSDEVERLLAVIPNWNSEFGGLTALKIAVRNGHIDIVENYLQRAQM